MNNKVLKIVLVVLIIIVFALSGFAFYEKTLKKDNNVDDNKTECKLATSLVSKFIGTYTYEGEYV